MASEFPYSSTADHNFLPNLTLTCSAIGQKALPLDKFSSMQTVRLRHSRQSHDDIVNFSNHPPVHSQLDDKYESEKMSRRIPIDPLSVQQTCQKKKKKLNKKRGPLPHLIRHDYSYMATLAIGDVVLFIVLQLLIHYLLLDLQHYCYLRFQNHHKYGESHHLIIHRVHGRSGENVLINLELKFN